MRGSGANDRSRLKISEIGNFRVRETKPCFEGAARGVLMSFSTNDIATFDFTRPCPICDQHLELSAIETVPWAPRTLGERLVFQCKNCGVAQTEWSSIPLVSAPEIVPDDPAALIEKLEQVST
jgi:hypothetical protein